MADKKRQHIIPQCYLRAWCDPHTPPGQHPFIWRINKDGSGKRKKSPEKSFVATDKYTIKLPNGERNLLIENTFGGIENDFVRVLSRIRKRGKLGLSERARLCLFTAAMHGRTTVMGDHWKNQQKQLHEQVVELERIHDAPPTLSRQTARYVELAHQHIIATSLEIEAPLLFQMKMTVLVTGDEIGFITSDTPCVWFNENLYKMPPFYRHPGLGHKDIEVTLPLTPHHLLHVSHTDRPEYLEVDQRVVDDLNRRTRFSCYEEFVAWKGETRPYWFDPGKEPDDSWERTAEGKKAVQDRILNELSETAPEGKSGTIVIPPPSDDTDK